MRFEVEHFTLGEFACPCCGAVRCSWVLVLWLELLRRGWGGAVRVNSAFRCPASNARVGGAPHSRHLEGCAADIAPVSEGGISRARWSAFAELTGRFFDNSGWELRFYARHIHVAVPRSEAARVWSGGAIEL